MVSVPWNETLYLKGLKSEHNKNKLFHFVVLLFLITQLYFSSLLFTWQQNFCAEGLFVITFIQVLQYLLAHAHEKEIEAET